MSIVTAVHSTTIQISCMSICVVVDVYFSGNLKPLELLKMHMCVIQLLEDSSQLWKIQVNFGTIKLVLEYCWLTSPTDLHSRWYIALSRRDGEVWGKLVYVPFETAWRLEKNQTLVVASGGSNGEAVYTHMWCSHLAPMSPVFIISILRELWLWSTTAPKGTWSLSSLISIPWQEPLTTNNGWDMPKLSMMTCSRTSTY